LIGIVPLIIFIYEVNIFINIVKGNKIGMMDERIKGEIDTIFKEDIDIRYKVMKVMKYLIEEGCFDIEKLYISSYPVSICCCINDCCCDNDDECECENECCCDDDDYHLINCFSEEYEYSSFYDIISKVNERKGLMMTCYTIELPMISHLSALTDLTITSAFATIPDISIFENLERVEFNCIPKNQRYLKSEK